MVLALTIAMAVAVALPQTSRAQTGTGWCAQLANGSCAYYSSYAAACARRVREIFSDAKLLGIRDDVVWSSKWCDYHTDSGVGLDATSSVFFTCASGFPLSPGVCVENHPTTDRCQVNNTACPTPKTARPIDLLSGAKLFHASDFASADDSLRLDRLYANFAYGGVSSSHITSRPLGLGNWAFGFAYELQIPASWATQNDVLVLSPGGTLYTFHRASDGSLVPKTTAAFPGPQTDLSLYFDGAWPANLGTLTDATTTWTLVDPDDTRWTLQTFPDPANGKLSIARPVSATTRQGRQLTFAYGARKELASITDSFGKSLQFQWLYGTVLTSNGTRTDVPLAISRASLPGGYSILYTYDNTDAGAGTYPERLVKVGQIDPQGALQDETTYVYGDPSFANAVTEIRDKDGAARWQVTYDGSGRAVRSSAPLGVESTTVCYGELDASRQCQSSSGSTIRRTVTTSLGKNLIHTFTPGSPGVLAPELTSIVETVSAAAPPVGTPEATHTFEYSNHFLVSETDQEGRVTAFSRDPRGLPTITTEASGTASQRITRTDWHPTLRVPSRITRPGLIQKDYAYNLQGQLISLTLTDLTSFTTPYSTNGRTRKWVYSWNPNGLLKSVDGPDAGTGDKTLYAYRANGYLKSITDGLGQATQISTVDWRGAPTTIVDPNGVSTTVTYDIHGRPLTITVDPGLQQSVYQLGYDAAGNLSRLTLPQGGYLQYSYDVAGRLATITNDRGEAMTLGSDAARNVVSVMAKDAAASIAFQESRVYDELGRLVRLLGAAGANQTTSYQYDKLGNLTKILDARSKPFRHNPDPLNRVVSETDPEGFSVQYGYDLNDQLTSLTDGRGLQTTLKVDGFGQVIEEVSPDRGTRSYWYDSSGRLTKLVDGDDEETDYTYDAIGRLTGTTVVNPAESSSYTYDDFTGGNFGVGRLTLASNGAGSSALTYDAQGRIVQEVKTIVTSTRTRVFTVGYDYDANGKVTQITLPSGRTISYPRAGDGLITGITSQPLAGTLETIVSNVSYAPFGPLKKLTQGNGLVLTRTYDSNYWLTRVRAAGTQTPLHVTFGRDRLGQTQSIIDQTGGGRGATFTYTDSERLASATGPWGDHRYAYDGSGNRTSVTEVFSSRPETQTFANLSPTSNRVLQTFVAGGAGFQRNLSYRTGGDLAQDQHASGPTYDYIYDATDRLKTIKTNGATTSQFLYDTSGHRVWSRESGQIYYIYDLAGRLLAEHDGSGAALREYIWLDELPVAMIDSSAGASQTYYIHAGELNEPLVMTRADQSTAWSAWFEPFGEAGTFSAPTAAISLRLPGQFQQSAPPGLYQNWRRDYDPSLGRYIEADPIGLAGGQNPYAYVDGRPTTLVDPTGQFAFTLPMIPIIVEVFGPTLLRLALVATVVEMMASAEPPEDPKKVDCGKDDCDEEYEREKNRCFARYSYSSHALRTCIERASINWDLCLRGRPTLSMLQDVDLDGWEANPPQRRHRWSLE